MLLNVKGLCVVKGKGYKCVSILQKSGIIEWRHNLGAALFSSPLVIPGGYGVAVGCVDGYLYALSHSGQQVYAPRFVLIFL